jgi:YebC/PmpR family DNA-binding regulatory protein
MGKGWKKGIATVNAQKKGKLFTKLAKEIAVAAKLGGPDPGANARLRMSIEAAREASCPKDTIERAIRKGAGLDADAAQIEEVTYEGYGPHKVGVLVECQTDNRNRTVPEIRNIFKSHDGHMGEVGSVAWMFDRVAWVEGLKPASAKDVEEEAIEANANEVTSDGDDIFSFYGAPEDLDQIRTSLTDRGWVIKAAELSYKPKNITMLSEEQRKELREFLEELDDADDTYRIHTTMD